MELSNEFLGWFTFLFAMIGGTGLGIYLLVGICSIGDDKKE